MVSLLQEKLIDKVSDFSSSPLSLITHLITDRGLFSNPSIEFIEVEENSSDDEDEEETNDGMLEENDPNIDAVVQSFLDVVGKCSEITQQVASHSHSIFSF
jgi:hypothetical protein